MTYKFVTREEMLQKMNEKFTPSTFTEILDTILAEREAYKLALMERIKDAGYGDAGLGDQADAEAARLLGEKK